MASALLRSSWVPGRALHVLPLRPASIASVPLSHLPDHRINARNGKSSGGALRLESSTSSQSLRSLSLFPFSSAASSRFSTALSAPSIFTSHSSSSSSSSSLPFGFSARHMSSSTGRSSDDSTKTTSEMSVGDAAASAAPPALPDQTHHLQSIDIETPMEIIKGIAHLGELRELGLGSYATPVGLLQNLVEASSALTHLPWAYGIALTTVFLRLSVLPLVIGAMRNGARLMNIQTEVQFHSDRMKACTDSGNKEGAREAMEHLQRLFKENNCHPLRSLLPSLAQMPIFISFFLGLRAMAELPVESLKHGGLLWFTDLTVQDPYYILPTIATFTMLATIELGSEGIRNTQPHLKKIFRVMPFLLLPVTVSFPAGMFMYWITANFFSLSQLVFLRVPALRRALDIPEQNPAAVAAAAAAAPSKQSFVEATKSAYQAYIEKHNENIKRMREKERTDALKNMKIPKRKV